MAATGTGAIELKSGSTQYDVTAFFRKFYWKESLIDGGWTWNGAFSVDEWPDWQNFLLGTDTPTRAFRLVTQPTTSGSEAATPWRTAIIDTSRSSVRGEALISRVYGGDRRLLMMQKARTRAWTATRVSDVLSALAEEYALTANIADTAARRDRWQLREDDWSFAYALSRAAATASGRGDAFLWLDEDVLHFGAPDLTAASTRRHDLATQENRVDRVVLSYQGRAVDRAGGATLLGVGYDLTGGAPVLFNMGAQAAQTMPSLASRVPRDPDGGLRVYDVIEDSAALVEEATRSSWGRVGPRYGAMRLDTRADLSVRPGDMIEVQSNLGSQQNASFFGRYVALEVCHTLTGGLIRTSLSCYRREEFLGGASPVGASASSGNTLDGYVIGREDMPRITLQARPVGS